MPSRYMRFLLVLELAAYLAIACWLHFLYGWGYAWLAATAIGAALLGRLAMVAFTTSLGHLAAAPRPVAHHIGIGGAAALVYREWRAVLANNFVYLPWHEYAMRADPQLATTDNVPVVLVHGYFSNRGYFRVLAGHLEEQGVAPLFTPNFSTAFATIEEFAAELHREIERVAAATGQGEMVLVCHSMGGLAARAYLCAHGNARVKKLITVASPHHGTVHARLGAGANARQMHRGSKFLVELCEQEARRGPRCGVTSIYSTHDNLVAPQETSRLDWAKNVALTGLGHLDILRSRRLAQVLLEELREAGVAIRL